MTEQSDVNLPREYSFVTPLGVAECEARVDARLPRRFRFMPLLGSTQDMKDWRREGYAVEGKPTNHGFELKQLVLDSPLFYERVARVTFEEEPQGTRVAFRLYLDVPSVGNPSFRSMRVLLSERWRKFDDAEARFILDWLKETLDFVEPPAVARQDRDSSVPTSPAPATVDSPARSYSSGGKYAARTRNRADSIDVEEPLPDLAAEAGFVTLLSVEECAERIRAQLPRPDGDSGWRPDEPKVDGVETGYGFALRQHDLVSPIPCRREGRVELRPVPEGTRVVLQVLVDMPWHLGMQDWPEAISPMEFLESERWQQFAEAETTLILDWLKDLLAPAAPDQPFGTDVPTDATPGDSFAAALHEVVREDGASPSSPPE